MCTNNTIQVLVIGDSRSKLFETFEQTEKQKRCYDLNVDYISVSSAKLEDLYTHAKRYIKRVDKDTHLLVKVVAGICNITVKSGKKISLREDVTSEKVVKEIRKLRKKLIKLRSRIIVSFCGIPPVNLPVYEKYATKGVISQNRLRELEKETYKICDLVSKVNYDIKGINKIVQKGITPQTASLERYCLHRKKKGGYQIIASALYDGVHATETNCWKWFWMVHSSIVTEIQQVEVVQDRKEQLRRDIDRIEELIKQKKKETQKHKATK